MASQKALASRGRAAEPPFEATAEASASAAPSSVVEEHGAEQAIAPAAKRRRQASLVCAGCGKNSDSVTWWRLEVARGTTYLVDGGCLECFKAITLGYEHGGTFVQVMAKATCDPAFLPRFQPSDSVRRGINTKTFFESVVHGMETRGWRARSTCRGLTAAQFQARFGVTPTEAGLRTKLLEGETGQQYQGVLVKDDTAGRVHEYFAGRSNQRLSQQLVPERHTWAGQEQSVYKAMNAT